MLRLPRFRVAAQRSLALDKTVRPRLEPLEDRLAPATRVWAGLGLDNIWSNHANWVGSVLPVPNDDLVFPANAPRLANVNNLPGYIFNSITFSGANYLITGNILGIRGPGIVQTVAGPNTFEIDTVFIGPEVRPLGVATGGTLTLPGRLLGPGGFAKTGGGTLVLAGTFANEYASVTAVQEGTLLLNKPAGVRAVPGELVVGDSAGGVESDVVRLTAPGQVAPAPVTVNGAGLLALDGNALTLPSLTLSGGRVDTGSATLTLTGNITANAAATPAILRGKFDLGSVPRTLSVANGAAPDDLVIQGTLTAGGALTKTGAGRLALEAANNLGGVFTVSAGVLNVRHGGALGATTAGTVIEAGAALELQGGIDVGAEPLTLTAGGSESSVLRNLEGRNSWAGAITLLSEVRFSTSDGRLDLTGAIRAVGGTWAVTKSGAGTLAFGGAAANTYTGTTLVAEGTLVLGKSAGVAAVAGPLVIGDAANPGRTTLVRLENSEQIADALSIMLVGTGSLDLNNFAETIGSVTFTGGKISTGTGTLTVNGNVKTNATDAPTVIAGNLALGGVPRTFTLARGTGSEDLLLSAVVQGTVGLVKQGPGILRLGGANTYTGTTTLAAGTLLLDGSVAGPVAVAAGAVLGGNGTAAAAVTVTGTLDPGQGPGVLRIANLTCASGSTVRVELNGTEGGTTHDQLAVAGTVNLSGATLAPALGFRSVGGNRYTILNNKGAGAVVGTFNGLPEGARLSVGGRPFTISYRGGDGNDVVLTDNSIATTTTLATALSVSRFGQPAGLSVTVQPASGIGIPTGRVTLRESGTTTTLTGALENGVALIQVPGLTVGTHAFLAEYEGDSTFSPSSSNALTQAIGKATTALRLTATPNSVRADQIVQLTAVLAVFQGGRPTGNVVFRDGTTTLGSVPIPAGGAVEFAVANLAPGAHVLTAAYDGDSTFEASTGTVTVQATPALSAEERFVTQLFVDLLGRSPDPQGLAAWTGELRGGKTRSQVVQGIQASEEYRTLIVQGLYQRLLRRRPDAGGLRAFVDLLGSGGTVEFAQAVFIGSPEYYQSQGGGTDSGWLAAAYRDALGRSLDNVGASAHSAGLATGVTRQRIAEILFASNEYRGSLVSDLYQRFLRRGAESSGLNTFVSELMRGARQEQLAAVIAGSGEYFSRV